MSIENYRNGKSGDLTSFVNDFMKKNQIKKTLSYKDITVDFNPAIYLETSFRDGDRTYYIFIQNDARVILRISNSIPYKYDFLKSIIDQILSTFRFTQ